VGHWEGDTLVVNSVGFNDKGWLDVGGNPQTESLRLTERFRRPDFGHLQLEVTFDDPKAFAKPFTLRMEKSYTADTEIFEDVCENERDAPHLLSGFKVAPEVLAKYAGTYELPGREAEVTVSGDQLIVKDSANSRDQLFVARSETEFLSSVSESVIEFAKDSSGAVIGYSRTGVGKDENAKRKNAPPQR
jgi:virulence-associated protein VagC